MMKLQTLSGALVALVLCMPAAAQNNELNWTMDRAVRQLDRQGSDLESVLSEVDVCLLYTSDAADDPTLVLVSGVGGWV